MFHELFNIKTRKMANNSKLYEMTTKYISNVIDIVKKMEKGQEIEQQEIDTVKSRFDELLNAKL